MESRHESSSTLQAQLKLARRSIVHYSNRLKKKKRRQSTVSGPSPAVLLLKAALDQPTLDHVIIPVLNQSDDESSSSTEESGKNKVLIELRSTLKEIQKCQKFIDEQMDRISAKKDGNSVERLNLLKISIGALGDSSKKFIELAEKQIDQTDRFKSTADHSSHSQLYDDNSDEFYDALDDADLIISMPYQRVQEDKVGSEQKVVRRTRVPNRPSNSINYLAFLRSCLSQSKDLSKIGMPVDFNEPLSALQRLTEDLDYSYLLDDAANETDQNRRLALVSIFALTAYATTSQRTSKPFNPLLSETFECDRRQDKGFISVAEQVSHHPPRSALWAQGKKWTLQQTYTPNTKIKGRSLYLNPLGSTYITFNDSPEDTYVYGKVTTITTMTNLVSGKLFMENVGKLTLFNIGSGARCILEFHGQSYFSRETQRRVTGTVLDADEKAHYEIEAVWDRYAVLRCLNSQTSKLIWEVNPLPEDSDKMHSFTQFAIELNEPTPGVPPTDSRNRIDQRKMEDGDWSAANLLKQQLEAAQRQRRADREDKGIEYKPVWFHKKTQEDQVDGNDVYVFDRSYLTCRQTADWSRCPRIFDL